MCKGPGVIASLGECEEGWSPDRVGEGGRKVRSCRETEGANLGEGAMRVAGRGGCPRGSRKRDYDIGRRTSGEWPIPEVRRRKYFTKKSLLL